MSKVVMHTSNFYYKFKEFQKHSTFYCQIMVQLYVANIAKI